MSTVFAKLNLKEADEIVVLNAPESFELEIKSLIGVSVLRSVLPSTQLQFALAFVSKQSELDAISKVLSSQAVGDATLWIAYPKQTSKRYRCEFNRDTGWEVLGTAGFEAVRMVAIDEDWSALRFRRVEFIKSMSRQL